MCQLPLGCNCFLPCSVPVWPVITVTWSLSQGMPAADGRMWPSDPPRTRGGAVMCLPDALCHCPRLASHSPDLALFWAGWTDAVGRPCWLGRMPVSETMLLPSLCLCSPELLLHFCVFRELTQSEGLSTLPPPVAAPSSSTDSGDPVCNAPHTSGSGCVQKGELLGSQWPGAEASPRRRCGRPCG